SIFNRRSRVWERFAAIGNFKEIYTLPGSLWAQWYATLNTSPTAGLLTLGWIARGLQSGALDGLQLRGYVAGFSTVTPLGNHSFDNEKLSERHNWDQEPGHVVRILRQLDADIGDFNCPLISEINRG
ncbi:MAG: hypothetical protein AAF404_22840, partial [Pseudomonadota bacterium]